MRLLSAVGVCAFVVGCASAPKSGPVEDLSGVCQIGTQVSGVKGSVLLKTKSKEASGQFPANLEAQESGELKMEVTNLLGGTEAVITVNSGSYSIQSTNKNVKSEQGYGTWGGIPLEWASSLFLGRIPCPSGERLKAAKTAFDSSKGILTAEVPASVHGGAEKYVYHLKGAAVDSLHWERQGTFGAMVDFKFDESKWEAKSSQGEVKVKWKDRQVSAR